MEQIYPNATTSKSAADTITLHCWTFDKQSNNNSFLLTLRIIMAQERTCSNRFRTWCIPTLFCVCSLSKMANAFVPSIKVLHRHEVLKALPSMDDDMTRQIEKARELIKKSKAKLAAQELAAEGTLTATTTTLPFFAKLPATEKQKRDQVTKTTDGNGLITTDGEEMARLSEGEEWEARAFADVFQSENDKYKMVNEQLSERDVAASMFNLRVTLQNEDFMKIFNERNRFIGETN